MPAAVRVAELSRNAERRLGVKETVAATLGQRVPRARRATAVPQHSRLWVRGRAEPMVRSHTLHTGVRQQYPATHGVQCV